MLSQNRQFLTLSPLSSFLLSKDYVVKCLCGYPPSPLPIRHNLWTAPFTTVQLKDGVLLEHIVSLFVYNLCCVLNRSNFSFVFLEEINNTLNVLGTDNLEMKGIDANLNISIKTISNQMAAEMTGINDNMTAMEAAIDEKFESVAANFSLFHPAEANTTSKC